MIHTYFRFFEFSTQLMELEKVSEESNDKGTRISAYSVTVIKTLFRFLSTVGCDNDIIETGKKKLGQVKLSISIA